MGLYSETVEAADGDRYVVVSKACAASGCELGMECTDVLLIHRSLGRRNRYLARAMRLSS